MVAAPIYIPTNSVGGFPFLHTLSGICYSWWLNVIECRLYFSETVRFLLRLDFVWGLVGEAEYQPKDFYGMGLVPITLVPIWGNVY